MKMKRLGFSLLLLALLTLLPGSSWAGEISMNRIYHHTNLKEARHATIQVLEDHDFRLVRRNSVWLTFVRRAGHEEKTVLTFSFRDKNHTIKVHVSAESSNGHGKHDDKKLRRTTERLLEAIRHKIH